MTNRINLLQRSDQPLTEAQAERILSGGGHETRHRLAVLTARVIASPTTANWKALDPPQNTCISVAYIVFRCPKRDFERHYGVSFGVFIATCNRKIQQEFECKGWTDDRLNQDEMVVRVELHRGRVRDQ